MRRNILLVQFVGVLLLLPSIMSGQQHSSDNKNWAEKGVVIREVEILGKRPMKDIGVQQTRFDSLVLKENIAWETVFSLPMKGTFSMVMLPYLIMTRKRKR